MATGPDDKLGGHDPEDRSKSNGTSGASASVSDDHFEPLTPGPLQKVVVEGLDRSALEQAVCDAVRRVAEAATDFSWLSRGDTVFLKPAVNSVNQYPATTHIGGVATMIKLLKEKGAKRVIVSEMSGVSVDSAVRLTPRGLHGSSRKILQKNGMLDAALAAGGEVYFPEEDGWGAFFEDGPVPGSHWQNGVFIPNILKECDHIVLMPRASRHMILGNTLGLKAVIGYMRTDSRVEYHRDASTIYEKTAEANTLPTLKNKLRLTLTVATRLQSTMGPDAGYVSAPGTGLVIASESLLAHDMLTQAWMNINRKLLPESQRTFYRDPHIWIHNIINHYVVMALGGPVQALKTQNFRAKPSGNLLKDPVLKRTFQLEGGVPVIQLVDVNGYVPDVVMSDLRDRVRLESNNI
jgi:uncharacterized protein (DUF362 family)